MLVEDYSVAIIACGSCGGSLGGDSHQLKACPFCGASIAGARPVSVFDYSTRMMPCFGCGAPVGVPIAGGDVACGYCNLHMEVTARRSEPLQSRDTSDEQERIAHLRRQDQPFVMVPRPLRPLMKSGGLVPETAEQATTMWQHHRGEVAAGRAGTDTTEELFVLTELLADFHNTHRRPLMSRAFLEAATEILDKPVHRQSMYCWLARNAARVGDEASARDWLALCDPRPYDLIMDSSVRMTWASLALHSGDWDGVLRALGDRAGIPVASKYESAVKLYRCHALEMNHGAAHAAEVLAASMPIAPALWHRLVMGVEAHHHVNLCPKSLEIAARRKNRVLPALLVLFVYIAIIALLMLDRFAGDRLWTAPALKSSATIALTVVATLLVGGPAWALFSRRSLVLKMVRSAQRPATGDDGASKSQVSGDKA